MTGVQTCALPISALFAGVSEAGLARFVETQLGPDMLSLEPDVLDRLRTLAGHPDSDVRATALAALHFARGNDTATRQFLAGALKSLGSANDAAVRGRWALVLGFLADSLASHGDPAAAVATYRKAIEIGRASCRERVCYVV